MADRPWRSLVLSERHRTLNRLDHLTAELDAIIETAKAAPPDDEHDIEGSSIGFERARVAALMDAERQHLDGIERALSRVDAGTYERCERCGAEIQRERLLALPATTMCVTCVGSVTAPLRPGDAPR